MKWKRIASYLLTALLSVTLTLAAVVAYWSLSGSGSKLEQLEALLLECFIGEADQTAIEDAAAEAMVDALGDRWSYYISADDYASYQDSKNNSYVGIGITILTADTASGVEIAAVTEGGPAEDAGLQAGDVIIEVDGEDVRGQDYTVTRDLIRGTAGTIVEIAVVRDGETLAFLVERRSIATVVATGTLLEGQIGYITIENFNSGCASETIAAIEELIEAGAEKFVFDVRNNPGGYVSQLVELLDYLLPEGDLFISEDYLGNRTVDSSDADFLDYPMAILVNSESYSAAEFFAAACQEYEAAVIVGTVTCGKGYFQQTFEFSDGSAVGLSVGKYYTPGGVSLIGVGVTPDIIVEVDDETFSAIYYGTIEPEDDPQLQAAIAALNEE